MAPEISLIMTTYNVEKHLDSAFYSLANQKNYDLEKLEVIAVDDKSTDGSVEKVRESIKKYDSLNIKLIELSKNSGRPAIPRNVAINNSSGDYVLRFDSDDMLHPLCLEEVTSAFKQNPKVGFIYTDHMQVSPPAKIPLREEDIIQRKTKPSFNLRKYLEGDYNFVAALNAVRREDCVLFDEEVKFSEDADWIIRIALNKVRFHHIQKPLYFWRKGIDSLTTRTNREDRIYWHDVVFQRGLKTLNERKK